ncbi:hypothetical protein OIV83_004593 [Microbotryomycetes sp. JL201]|nr:hypothetical protein OIV83_004593 [Microbotryomycetes sp. JL201]
MEVELVKHLLARMIADVDFLAAHHVVNAADADMIRQKLRAAGDNHALSGGVSSVSLGQQHVTPSPALSFGSASASAPLANAPPPPPAPPAQQSAKQQCRAMWDYPQTQPDDLGFTKGDIITIEKEENADWWRGSLNGRTGIFPSNHVERISQSTVPPPPPAVYGSTSPAQSFAPSPASQQPQYAYQQPQGYGPPASLNEKQPYADGQYAQSGTTMPVNNFHTYNPPAGLTTVQPEQAGAADKPKKNHKFAKHMGTSFAGGAGFGAGAAVTSNIINSIF